MKKENFLIRKLCTAGIMIFILILCASVVSGQANFTEDENLKSNQKRSDNPLLKLSDDKKNWQAIPVPKFAKPTGKLSSSNLTRVVEYDIVAGTVNQSEFLESKIKMPAEIASNLAQSYGIYQPNEPIETVFPPDNRIKISPTVDFPWRTICKLYVTFPDGNHFVGSGVLVGRNDGKGFHCLTAAHCVFRNEYGGYAATVEVIPALDNDYTPFYSAWTMIIRTPQGWNDNSSAEFDWACLTLDRQIGNFTGWMDVFTPPDRNWYQRNFRCAGYPIDLDFGLCLYYDSDTSKSVDDDFLYYSMDASTGQDGMPVWAKDDNTRKIVSIHIGEADGVEGNRGLRINDEKLRQLNQWIDGDPAPIDLPDLVDDGPKWSNFKPSIVVRGFSQFNVWNDVRNIGTAPSTPLTVAYYASMDPVIDPKTDFLIGTTDIESLPPFAWRDSNWLGIFPEAIPAGEYYIGWIIDSENQVPEFEETNNQAFITSKKLLVKDPYIEIVKPNGGEAFAIGEQNYIEWFTAGDSGSVTIDVSYDDGISWQNLVTNIPDSGRYGWNILPSQAPVFSCLIKITTSKNLIDFSDAPFNIETRPTIPGIPYADRAWISKPEVLFKWTSANDPETGISGYHVQIGTTPNSNDIADTLIDNVLNYNAIGTHNQKLYAKVRSINGVGLESLWSASSKGILIDLTPPILQGGPFDEGEFCGKDSVLFTWNPATDKESGIIMNYKLQVGTAIGLNDVFDKWINRKLENKVVGKDGQTLYARIKVHNAAIGVSDWSDWSDGITIDLTPPSAPGKPYSDEPTINVLNIPLSWNQATDDQSGVTDYRLKILDVTANNQVVFDEWVGGVLQYSVPVNNDHAYIALVQAKNGGGLAGNWSLTSEPITIKRTPIPLILIDYSAAWPSDDWPNAIDNVVEDDLDGTVSAKTYFEEKPYAIFSIAGENSFNIDKIRLITNGGAGWESWWIKRFRLLYSLTGTNDSDFIELLEAEKHGGDWEEYTFPEQLVRYIKLVIDLPDLNTAGYAYLAEFEVYGNFELGKLSKTVLRLHSGTPTWPNREWSNAIDNDIEGDDGTVCPARYGIGGIKPYGIFAFLDSAMYMIAKVRLLTDTKADGWIGWAKTFRIDVSTTGTNDEDFKTVFIGEKSIGGWESFYFIPVMAKYVKLVLLETNRPREPYFQIGEFEVYKTDSITQSSAKLYKILNQQSNLQDKTILPENFYVTQNYPNPFNPETTIGFQIPVDSQVILKIYNLMGQEITTLVDGLLPAGNHSIIWNGHDNKGKKAPSGMYLYQFRAGNYNVTKKMVLLE